MSDRLLRRPAVEERTGLSRSALYDAMARGQFPRPVAIGRRAVAWPASLIDLWVESRKASTTKTTG